jgi:hypothetical protein
VAEDEKGEQSGDSQSGGGGNIVQLSHDEEREVRKRSALRAAVVFETVRREGETEVSRPALALAFSVIGCGFCMV